MSSMPPEPDHSDLEPQYAKLAEALRKLELPSQAGFPTLDEALRQAAIHHFERRSRRRMAMLGMGGGAVAAGIALAIILRSSPAVTPPQQFAVGDIDANGRVDILDAFMLARTLAHGKAADDRADLSGDGRIDDADVQAIAAMAVSISTGSSG
jgi:hypothetical protein